MWLCCVCANDECVCVRVCEYDYILLLLYFGVSFSLSLILSSGFAHDTCQPLKAHQYIATRQIYVSFIVTAAVCMKWNETSSPPFTTSTIFFDLIFVGLTTLCPLHYLLHLRMDWLIHNEFDSIVLLCILEKERKQCRVQSNLWMSERVCVSGVCSAIGWYIGFGV